jgi:hypothetical protein
VEASHIKTIPKVLEKCGELKFSKGICDKWVTNFDNMVLDKGYYFYEPPQKTVLNVCIFLELLLPHTLNVLHHLSSVRYTGAGAQKFRGARSSG